MNFLLVLGLVTTAAFAAPVQEKEVLQVAAADGVTNRDSRDASISKSPKHDLSESSLESTVKLHESTSSESSLGNGISFNENKSTESKESRALAEDEQKLEATESLGKELSESPASHVGIAGDVSGHEHNAGSIISGDGDGGHQKSTDSENNEGSDSHDDNVTISSLLHLDASGIKGNNDDSLQGSGEGELVGEGNEKQSLENWFHSKKKSGESSTGERQEGIGHTDIGKPKDELGHGGNDESSIGVSTEDVTPETVVTSQTVENKHQSKDNSEFSDSQRSENKEPKALVAGGSNGAIAGSSESETVINTDSSKPHSDGTGRISGSKTAENSRNEHRTPKELVASLETHVSSGRTEGSNTSVYQSENGQDKQEINSNRFGIKEETEIKPVSHVDQTSNNGEPKGSGAGYESDLNIGNILQGSFELSHSIISTESSRKIVSEDTATHSSKPQSDDLHLSSGLAVGGNEKDAKKLDIILDTGHKEAEQASSSGNSSTKGHNEGNSRSLQNQHEIPASSNGKFTLPNTDRVFAHVIKAIIDHPISETKSNDKGSNRNQYDGLGVDTGSESIHGKGGEYDLKGSISFSDKSRSTISGECGDGTKGADTQNQVRSHRGFAWIDDDNDGKPEGTGESESRITEVGQTDSKLFYETTTNKNEVSTTGTSSIVDSGSLGVKLESSAGDENQSKAAREEKHKNAIESEQVKTGVSNIEVDTKSNTDEQTEHALSSESSEKKNVDTSVDISGLSKDLKLGHVGAKDLIAGLEIHTGEEGGSTAEDSSVREKKHGASLNKEQGGSAELVIPTGATINV